MFKQALILGAMFLALPATSALADGPQEGAAKSGTPVLLVRGRTFARPRTATNYTNNGYSNSGYSNNAYPNYSYRTQPSTQPSNLAPSNYGPAYQRYSQQPYYMRAERKALGMLP